MDLQPEANVGQRLGRVVDVAGWAPGCTPCEQATAIVAISATGTRIRFIVHPRRRSVVNETTTMRVLVPDDSDDLRPDATVALVAPLGYDQGRRHCPPIEARPIVDPRIVDPVQAPRSCRYVR